MVRSVNKLLLPGLLLVIIATAGGGCGRKTPLKPRHQQGRHDASKTICYQGHCDMPQLGG